MSDAMKVGKRLVEMCRANDFMGAIKELYADDIVSVEAAGPPGKPLDVYGKQAVIGKSEWWMDNHEVHGCKIEGPFPNGNQFIATFDMDVTAKSGPMAGKRFRMFEGALYTVKDGKVVHEAFFYDMGSM